MNFKSQSKGELLIATDLSKLTSLADAIKDAIPTQEYSYMVSDLEDLLKEVNKTIVAGAQAIAHEAQVAQELAESREKKATRNAIETKANIEAKRAS